MDQFAPRGATRKTSVSRNNEQFLPKPSMANKFKSAFKAVTTPPVAGNGTSPSKTFCGLNNSEKKLITDAIGPVLKKAIGLEAVNGLTQVVSGMTQNPGEAAQMAEQIPNLFKITNGPGSSNVNLRRPAATSTAAAAPAVKPAAEPAVKPAAEPAVESPIPNLMPGGRRKTRTARRKSRKANRKSARTARRKASRKSNRKANRKSRKN